MTTIARWVRYVSSMRDPSLAVQKSHQFAGRGPVACRLRKETVVSQTLPVVVPVCPTGDEKACIRSSRRTVKADLVGAIRTRDSTVPIYAATISTVTHS